MPVITYQGAHLSTEMKKELIEKLTATAVEITQTPSNFFTVIIQEFSDENLGVNGESVSDIKARLHG
ncbi:4-oxalocrotonate tautomerase DmpI [Desulfosediminicola flagellatus]|uniref:4-oxalocrotonate tautomerase DmpI n=1 Tax=Desulfosediminicola flagellatus TaxID=2569541 RepID=UPI0010ACF4BA|nr:4-oxalocrotonate tautomerase DmpI [Desulfosediminicola flagellatus]